MSSAERFQFAAGCACIAQSGFECRLWLNIFPLLLLLLLLLALIVAPRWNACLCRDCAWGEDELLPIR